MLKLLNYDQDTRDSDNALTQAHNIWRVYNRTSAGSAVAFRYVLRASDGTTAARRHIGWAI
jgi:hypothetical protein